MKEKPLEELDVSAFEPLVNSTFLVRLETGEAIPLVLVEAKPLLPRQAGPGSGARSFALTFHGPDRILLPQRIHHFSHEQLGGFEMFIVPLGRKPGIFEYQAVFNRLG